MNKYKDLTVKDLKKALRNLKSRDKLRNDNTQSDPKQDVRQSESR